MLSFVYLIPYEGTHASGSGEAICSLTVFSGLGWELNTQEHHGIADDTKQSFQFTQTHKKTG